MKKYFIRGGLFYVLLLISLVGFLVFSRICSAGIIDDIDLNNLEDYLELSPSYAKSLISTIRNSSAGENYSLWSSLYHSEEELAVAGIFSEIIKGKVVNRFLVEVPLEVIKEVVIKSLDIVRMILAQDFSAILDKIEEKTVNMAISYGLDILLKDEIKIANDAVQFGYKSPEGEKKTANIQYIVAYKSLGNKNGEVMIRFYSPNVIKNVGTLERGALVYNGDISPFIIDVQGQVNNYQWVGDPMIDIKFLPNVPDPGIKPLGFWEKYVLKPIESTLKEAEAIIIKITGKSPNIVKTWEKIKSFLSKAGFFSPAAIIQPPIFDEMQKSEGSDYTVEKDGPEQKNNKNLSLEEIQEILDDIEEKIDVLNQKIAELNKDEYSPDNEEDMLPEEDLLDEEEEETIEDENEEESAEEQGSQELVESLCEKIPGSYPAKNKVIINEVAWMGGVDSANKEWIELKNIFSGEIKLSGWQLLDKDNHIKIVFADKNHISASNFYLLERMDDNSVLGVTADLIYNGVLNNTEEALYLFDENCQLQDEVFANPNWPAGDNSSKRTLERRANFNWQTSLAPGGTPKRENSSGYIEPITGGGGGDTSSSTQQSSSSEPTLCSTNNDIPIYSPVIFSEIAWMGSASSSADEWIELKNISTSTVSLNNWQLQGLKTEDNAISIKTFFSSSDVINGSSYYLLERTDDNSVLGIQSDKIFSGSINDSEFVLRLFNEQCVLVDEVGATSTWPAGQKDAEKRTMERAENLAWHTTLATSSINGLYGTPKAPNSQPFLPPENQNPLAYFSFYPQNIFIGDKVIFDASSSTDPDGNIISYSWDFGDGSSTTNPIATTSHSFSLSGDFTVNLRVVDDEGEISVPSATIITVAEIAKVEHLVINEIQIDSVAGEGGAEDDWVELYNPTDEDVSLNGWSIQRHSINGESLEKKNFESNHAVLSKGYFLIVRNEANNNLKLIADMACSALQLSSSNTVYLVNNNEYIGEINDPNIVDRVGFGDAYSSETNPFSNPPGGESIQRKGMGTDTDDNSKDFEINADPTPTNSRGEGGPTFLSGYPAGDNFTFSLSGSPYIITNTLIVPESKTLTIEPGVVLKFYNAAGLEVRGTLKSNGEEKKKILFTSFNAPSYWQGIYFASSSVNSEINWSEIKYGQRGVFGEPPAILVEKSSIILSNSSLENYTDRGLKLVGSNSVIEKTNFLGAGAGASTAGIEIEGGGPIIKNCDLIRANKYGIYIEYLSGENLAQIEGNNFENNEKAIFTYDPNAIFKNNRAEKDNTINGILLSNNIGRNLTWFKNDISYLIGTPPSNVSNRLGISKGTILTIEPGVKVEFANGGILEINGTLLSLGTEEEPITFGPYPGGVVYKNQAPWRRMYFGSSSVGSILNNTIVSDGGGYIYQSQIYVDQSSIEFINSTSTNAIEACINFNDSTSTVSNSYFGNGVFGMKIYGINEFPQLGEGLKFGSNSVKDIYIEDWRKCSLIPEYLATSTKNNCYP